MPFIPHTEEDIRAMLQAIGIASIDELFDEIPPALRSAGPIRVPAATTEMAIARIMHDRAERDGTYLNFIGAGAYEHHIPAAVWQIATRGEFYSSYTPYQAEASQGTLQLLYEYQTMMSSLLALDATNASLYDGASALAEAALMAVRAHKSAKRVLMPRTVHPIWRKVVRTITRNQGIELFEIDYDRKTGHVSPASLALFEAQDIAALVIPQPNFFGVLEPVDELVAWAHTRGALAIAALWRFGMTPAAVVAGITYNFLPFMALPLYVSLEQIDRDLAAVTTNWRLERLSAIDRSVLRLAATELRIGETPPVTVIKEAIHLAERFGTDASARFVNGVLDALARRLGRI